MLFTKALALILVPLALAAPAPGLTKAQKEAVDNISKTEANSINALFSVIGDVVVGPGGYIKDGVFHEGDYTPTETENEKRIFFTTIGLILRKLGNKWTYRNGAIVGGGGGGAGGGGGNPSWGIDGCSNCYQVSPA